MRHEFFVREYIRTGGNGAEAYRRIEAIFPNKPVLNPDCYRVMACVIRKRPEVRKREEELREVMMKKSDITIEKILTDYEEAKNMARHLEKPGNMIDAATAQAKLVGLLRDRVETGNVGDFDGMDDISDIIEKVANEVGPEAALALAKSLGYDSAEINKEEASELMEQTPPSDSVN